MTDFRSGGRLWRKMADAAKLPLPPAARKRHPNGLKCLKPRRLKDLQRTRATSPKWRSVR